MNIALQKNFSGKFFYRVDIIAITSDTSNNELEEDIEEIIDVEAGNYIIFLIKKLLNYFKKYNIYIFIYFTFSYW